VNELSALFNSAPRRTLTDHEVNWFFSLPDEVLRELPEISRHNEPQIAPQEYECGCVAITRITDRDTRRHERPFEMRLAQPCGKTICELRMALFMNTELNK
jgi:hypothetical protein